MTIPCITRKFEITSGGIVDPLPETVKPEIPMDGVEVADHRKDVPGTLDVRRIATFWDPEQIDWVGGLATTFDIGCTNTSKLVGIPGHPFLIGTII